jgi:hypothetical protein
MSEVRGAISGYLSAVCDGSGMPTFAVGNICYRVTFIVMILAWVVGNWCCGEVPCKRIRK